MKSGGGKLRVVGAIVLGAVLTSDTSYAARIAIPVGAVHVIARGDGVGRVVMDFPTEAFEGFEVISAFLDAPLPGNVADEDFEVSAYTLTTNWRDGTPTWTRPWEHPGGDIDDSLESAVSIPAGSATTRLRVDVTQATREMARGHRPRNGFLLTLPLGHGDGFGAPERAVLGPLAEVKLEVTYLRVPPRVQ